MEFSPALFLTETMRTKLHAEAREIGKALRYLGLGTIEFLISNDGVTLKSYFLELNPRLQVEHTVTEEVTGIDLVSLQLRIAAGARLKAEALPDPLSPNGLAIQLRINTEAMQLDGSVKPTSGCIEVFDMPSGPGVRIDTVGHVGYCNSLDYDSLLAKLIIHTPSNNYQALLRKAYRALCETNILGVATNLEFLRNLLSHPMVQSDSFDVVFVDQEARKILSAKREHRSYSFQGIEKVSGTTKQSIPSGPEGSTPVFAPSAGRIIELYVSIGDTVEPGQIVAITEAMKMEFTVLAEIGGKVAALPQAVGSVVDETTPVVHLWPDGRELEQTEEISSVRLDHVRDDLQRIFDAHDRIKDAARPDAVARRRKTGQRTARENISDLADEGSFLEYGGLALAAQRGRRSFDELQKMSPADGLITGTGTINADEFSREKTRCAILAYDYTVFAGTQGVMAHLKKNRIFRLVEKYNLPVVMFAEGGGGRPGDTDDHGFPKLYNPTFWQLAKLSSQVPVIAIVSGRCFAGNAALVGCADVIIATRNASIGMGGPAMIEGGGLGQVEADDIGPVSMQSPNGVVDIVVEDEVEAVSVAKAVLSYTQGVTSKWVCEDQRYLRHIIPEEPRRAYEMRDVIRLLADSGYVVELQPEFGVGLITAFVRIEGIPFAVIANNPHHRGGAIDAAASAKAANFSSTVEKFGLPLIKLCDTPGFMVGPEAEQEGLVREAGRMFSSGAKLTVPQFTIVVRKAYGLGALAMVSGNIYEQVFTVSWPTGHFGKMGLEGQIRLAYRKELDALPDEAARELYLRGKVNELHEGGNPVNAASLLSLDDVIDPLDTRDWLIGGFHAAIGNE